MPTNLHRFYGAGYLHFITSCNQRRELRYMHRNPVVRGLVLEPERWDWSSYRHYACGERGPVLVNEAQKGEMRGIA